MNIRVATRQKVKNFLTFPWHFTDLLLMRNMLTFTLAFLQAVDSFLFIFNLFPLFSEWGRRCLKESIHNENHWPQLLHVSNVECQIDRFACFAVYFSSFPKKKCISKSWRKLQTGKHNSPRLFTDFDKVSKIFPDFSQNAYNYGAHMPYIILLPCFRVHLIIIA